MVYKCIECGQSLWSDDCTRSYANGGSGVIVCPDCEAGVRKEIGAVEKAIFKTLPKRDSLSKQELVSQTSFSEYEIKNALRHLIDMGYMGTTPGWDYRLGTRGREKKQKIQ